MTIMQVALRLSRDSCHDASAWGVAAHEMMHHFYLAVYPKVCDPDPLGGKIVDLFVVTEQPIKHAASVALRKSLGDIVEEQCPGVTHAFYLRCSKRNMSEDAVRTTAYEVAHDPRVHRVDIVRR